MSSPAAKEEMNQSASDNAASALGKIVEHQSATAAFDSNQVRVSEAQAVSVIYSTEWRSVNVGALRQVSVSEAHSAS